jgi:hypothetical protein
MNLLGPSWSAISLIQHAEADDAVRLLVEPDYFISHVI